MVEMQRKHGLEMGTMLFSEKALKTMVSHISQEMRRRLFEKIKNDQVQLVFFFCHIVLKFAINFELAVMLWCFMRRNHFGGYIDSSYLIYSSIHQRQRKKFHLAGFGA